MEMLEKNMPTLKQDYLRVPADKGKYEKGSFNSLPKSQFKEFAPSSLGLGDVSKASTHVQALAAIYDLEGFTAFSNQVDSHLILPEFLQRYLDWFFDTLRESFIESEGKDRVHIWGSLPFFAKFMGDGLLLLWDTQYSGGASGIRNTVIRIHAMTKKYVSDFLPKVRKHVQKPPLRLRCGIARGQVVSIGEGGDYVGSCINIAARLQKLNGLSFAISRTGFDLSDPPQFPLWSSLVLKQVDLRGMDSQLVYVPQAELQGLPAKERKAFRDVE